MKYLITKNAVMCQGLGAVGLIQFGGTVFVFGDTGSNRPPIFEIVLFRPYSKKWFIFNVN